MTREISRPALAEALLSTNPPILLEALPVRHFAAGHLPTARPLPLDQVGLMGDLGLETDRAIVVYCTGVTCPNSHRLAALLATRGYADVAVYAGGKEDWTAAGLRLES